MINADWAVAHSYLMDSCPAEKAHRTSQEMNAAEKICDRASLDRSPGRATGSRIRVVCAASAARAMEISARIPAVFRRDFYVHAMRIELTDRACKMDVRFSPHVLETVMASQLHAIDRFQEMVPGAEIFPLEFSGPAIIVTDRCGRSYQVLSLMHDIIELSAGKCRFVARISRVACALRVVAAIESRDDAGELHIS